MKNSPCKIAALAACMWASGCFEDQVPPAYDYYQNNGTGDGDAGDPSGGDGDTGDDGDGTGDGDATGDGGASGDGDLPAPSDKCDLTGRWLVTTHKAISALVATQIIHEYMYYEIQKDGDAFVISKGLYCGDNVVCPSLNLLYNSSVGWDASMKKSKPADRTVTSKMKTGGCEVQFGKWYFVLGLSDEFRTNTSLPLGTMQAIGSQPGWEDWDEDGKPGVTIDISSAAGGGNLYTTQRSWSQFSATLPDVTVDKIRLNVTWNQEQKNLGNTNAILDSSSAMFDKKELNFVELHRLDAKQAVGDDAAICQAIRGLAKTLTPDANGYHQ